MLDAFRHRDVSTVEVDYLYVEGSRFKMHPGAGTKPVLVAWGITTDSRPVLLSIEAGSAESIDAWRDFLQQMTARGCARPRSSSATSGPGTSGGRARLLYSAHQRCLVHRARRVLATVPRHVQEQVNQELWAIWSGIEDDPGEGAVSPPGTSCAPFP